VKSTTQTTNVFTYFICRVVYSVCMQNVSYSLYWLIWYTFIWCLVSAF